MKILLIFSVHNVLLKIPNRQKTVFVNFFIKLVTKNVQQKKKWQSPSWADLFGWGVPKVIINVKYT